MLEDTFAFEKVRPTRNFLFSNIQEFEIRNCIEENKGNLNHVLNSAITKQFNVMIPYM